MDKGREPAAPCRTYSASEVPQEHIVLSVGFVFLNDYFYTKDHNDSIRFVIGEANRNTRLHFKVALSRREPKFALPNIAAVIKTCEIVLNVWFHPLINHYNIKGNLISIITASFFSLAGSFLLYEHGASSETYQTVIRHQIRVAENQRQTG